MLDCTSFYNIPWPSYLILHRLLHHILCLRCTLPLRQLQWKKIIVGSKSQQALIEQHWDGRCEAQESIVSEYWWEFFVKILYIISLTIYWFIVEIEVFLWRIFNSLRYSNLLLGRVILIFLWNGRWHLAVFKLRSK